MSHVVTVIRETVAALSASPAVEFGHGEESYQNLQGDEEEIQGDVAWLHPFLIIDSFAKNGLLYQTYRLTMHFGTQSNLYDSTAQLETYLNDMFDLTSEFLIRLDNDTRVAPRNPADNSGVLNIRRAPLYHTLDINVTGYALEFDLTITPEAFDYCITAPSTFDVTTLSCTQLADLTDGQHACIIEHIADATLVANVTASQQAALIAAFCAAFVDAEVFESDGVTPVITLGSGDTYNIPTHDIILPDGITNLETKEFNEDTNLVRSYNKVMLTGQTNIYNGKKDDGWHNQNGTYLYNTVGVRPIVDPDDQTKLLNKAGNENAFGNFERFTDDLGGSDFAGRNYKLCHATGYAATYDFTNPAGLTTRNANIDWAEGLVHNGFDDWRVPNFHEIMVWARLDNNNRWFATLLNFNIADRFLTSTSDTSILHYLAHNSLRELRRQNNNNYAFAIRDHYS